MHSPFTIAVQYLEDGPEIAQITPASARACLRAAFERLPITLVLIGWNLPLSLVEACREETNRAGAQLYLWHPLLTADGVFTPRPEWLSIGANGAPLRGHRAMPEFTFVCPNQAAARAAIQARVAALLQSGLYDGFFLDKIRFHSPAPNPVDQLGYFCPACRQAAAANGLDLATVRAAIKQLLALPDERPFLATIFGTANASDEYAGSATLRAFLDFRCASITQLVYAVAAQIHAAGAAVGLDSFSPALTRMVGQNLQALAACAEWTKVMSYCHTLGPAGLPFELLGLLDWLVTVRGVAEAQALSWLAEASGLPLPASRQALLTQGLPPAALAHEMASGRAAGVNPLFAGIELVEIPGIAHLNDAQINADLAVLRHAPIDGLVLSWDLWHIPPARLDLLRAGLDR